MTFSFKNILTTKINSSTEESLVGIQTQANKLSFDINSNLSVQSGSSFSTQIKNASSVTNNPATQDSLSTVKTQTDKLTFANGRELATLGTAPALASAVNFKDVTAATSNPAQLESVQLWARIAKRLESQSTVDSGNLQRVAVDAYGTGVITGNGVMTGSEPSITVASDQSITSPTTFTTPITWVGHTQQMFADIARSEYARGIRSRLTFT